jgi:hypothetical protein
MSVTPDLSLRIASVAGGIAVSVLPLASGTRGGDVALAVVGALAAVGAVGPDSVVRGRRSWLPTGCVLAAVLHLAVRAMGPIGAVAEAVLVACYLALAATTEMCWGAPVTLLRWAAAPVAFATAGAGAAAIAAGLADGRWHPLPVAMAGIAAVALLFIELNRRRSGS